MKNITLTIDGMNCQHCLTAVRQALHKLPGIEVKSVQMGRADLRYSEQSLSPDQVVAALEAVGYPAALLSAPGN
jgi:copper chaperone